MDPTTNPVMMAWHLIPTKAEFVAGTRVDGTMYFIKETGEIYRGTDPKPYGGSFILVENFDNLPEPANASQSAIYLNKATLAGKMSDGTQWIDVITPVDTTNFLTRLEWDGTEAVLDLYAGEIKKQTVTFSGLGVSLQYTKETGDLQLLDATGNTIGTAIHLDLERFVTGGDYDAATKTITLYFDGKTGAESVDKVAIPVGDLVDTYTVENTSSVAMSMSNNKISAAIRLSSATGNALVIKEDGLFADMPADISAVTDRLQAVEAAVDEIKATIEQLQTTGSVKVDGVTIVADPETGVISVGAIDIAKVNNLQAKLDASLTTESISTAMPADGGADNKVLSEKAIVNALSWKTGM